MRQKRKQILTITALLGAVALCAAPSLALAQPLVETIVTNPLTGVAIDGYDPVSYFTDSGPRQGVPEFALEWQGVTWYFSSEANRDVFVRHPDVYAPQYGGHCAMSLARGYLSDGNPRLFTIVGVKLYLFYSVANREAFFQAESSALASAETQWKVIAPTLVGPQAPVIDSMSAANPGAAAGADGAQTPAGTALVPAKQ